MEIYRTAIELAKWPLDRALDVGDFVLRAAGQEHVANKLRAQDSQSRAQIALRGTRQALGRLNIDQDLVGFWLRKSANEVDTLSREEPELVKGIMPDIVDAALQLPDNARNQKLTEEIVSTALEGLAPPHITNQTEASNLTSIRGIRPPHSGH